MTCVGAVNLQSMLRDFHDHRYQSVNQNWQQVETAADWISCSLPGLRRPFRGVRRVMVVPCLRRPASRCRGTWRPPAFSVETQLHGTPARRDIPRRPSNLTFVAVPKLKRNTSRRPPSALRFLRPETEIMRETPWSRIRGQNSVNKEVWEIVGNGKLTGSVLKETNE